MYVQQYMYMYSKWITRSGSCQSSRASLFEYECDRVIQSGLLHLYRFISGFRESGKGKVGIDRRIAAYRNLCDWRDEFFFQSRKRDAGHGIASVLA